MGPPNPRSAAKVGRAVAQPITAPLSRAAIFLTATLNPGPATPGILRSFCADLSGLFRAVEFRNIEAGLSCVMAVGSVAWDQLFGPPRRSEVASLSRDSCRRSPCALHSRRFAVPYPS
jgi:putative iron-dependent peroxidase